VNLLIPTIHPCELLRIKKGIGNADMGHKTTLPSVSAGRAST